MKKRILSVVLSAAMAFVGIAAGVWEPVTVYAGDEGNPFDGIYIAESGNLNPSEDLSANDNGKYFVITGSGENSKCKDVTPADGTVPETYNFHYDSSSHILTLKDMNVSLDAGNVIASEYKADKITIELIGRNTVKTASGEAICLNGNTTVTGSGSLTAVTTSGNLTDEQGNLYYPAAIQIGESCKRFENRATITATAQEAKKQSWPEFSAGTLAYGDSSKTYEGGKTVGCIVNYGTVNGTVDLFDGSSDGLISLNSKYAEPACGQGHEHIGKAYFWLKEEVYPNNILKELPEGECRVIGEYYENGEPKSSKVYYEYSYWDDGTVRTDENVRVLVYGEPELTKNDIVAVYDGGTHTFGTASKRQDLFAVWMTDGNVTVNGDVFWDVACMREPQVKSLDYDDAGKNEMERLGLNPEEYKDGIDVYVRDDQLNVKFNETSGTQNVVVYGNIGCFSLNESYKGSATINGEIYYCALYRDETLLNQKKEGNNNIPKYINERAWKALDVEPEEVYYYSIPKENAEKIAENGAFTAKVTNLKFDNDVQMKGSGMYEGTRFVQTETTKGDNENVVGTSGIVNDKTLLVNVSKSNGLENGTYPCVRNADDEAKKEILSHLVDSTNMIGMDIAVIASSGNKIEPTGMVSLYFDKLDLSGLSNPALFHIKDNGVVEKLAITTSGGVSTSVKCETNSFSTYVFAEDQTIINPPPTTPSGGDSYGGGASSGGTTGKPTTETKPDGTKVETSTDTKADGTKVDTTVETKTDGTKTETVVETKTDGAKTETVVETKTDGTKTETVVETAKDGSVKTTETVTNSDGSAVKTEKETEMNTKGKEVAVTTTTETDADGKVTGITQTSEIEQISGSASATVTVEKTADGKITSAEAEVDKKGANSKQGVQATLFGSVISQITEAAGTQSVEISMTVTAGKKEYTVKADAQDLEAGNKLKVMAINEKTGKHVLVNAKTYTVNKNGNVKLTLPEGMTYQLMDTKEAAVVEKQILATVKVKKTSATIAEGKKLNVQMSKKLDMENVAKITYSTSKKSVAAVSKNGQVTGKNTGSAVITVKVTLNNGKTKTLKMSITVG